MKNVSRSMAIALFVVTSFVTTSRLHASDRNSVKDEEKRTPASHALEGIWEQKILYGGAWHGGGLEEVTYNGNQLRMLPLEHIPSLINSRGIANAQHVLDIWTFDSDWGEHGTGSFQLTRETDDRYVGYAYRGGIRLNANVWNRIAIPSIRKLATKSGHDVNVFESDTDWYVVDSESGFFNTSNGENEFVFRNSQLTLTVNSSSKPAGSPPRSAALWVIPKSEVADINAVSITLNAIDRR